MQPKEGGRLALLFRSDSGSMWAGRPHSYGYESPISARINVGGSPTLLWRQVADIVEDRLLGLSIEIGEATGLECAEWRFF